MDWGPDGLAREIRLSRRSCGDRGDDLVAVGDLADLAAAQRQIAALAGRTHELHSAFVIARDGAVTQLAPFNRTTWHAGVSQWGGRSGVNAFSIGIELDNAGRLERAGQHWRSPLSKRAYADDDVVVVFHGQAQQLVAHRATDRVNLHNTLFLIR